MVNDFPKIESPFVRKLNEKGEYVVTPEISKDLSWVFDDPEVKAIEKLHGTNISIVIEDGQIKSFWNRTARIPFFNKGKEWITQGVLESYSRGYCELEDGQWFGELIGEKVNGNPYSITGHLWIPFKTYAWEHLAYKSWGKYPKTYEAINEWFMDLQPLYSWKIHGQGGAKDGVFDGYYMDKKKSGPQIHFVEGIVFTHPDGRLAKLRRDMFEWYGGARHKE